VYKKTKNYNWLRRNNRTVSIMQLEVSKMYEMTELYVSVTATAKNESTRSE